MAPAKFERIVSVSSEDPSFPAENLLKNAFSDKKWKCKSIGEKQVSVVLQLERADVITGIDIGNCGSALVEVLVSKSSVPDDFKVLVVASSLLSLQEAKLGTNMNSVRFFKEDNLVKDVASEKWDRIKLICTQPYNKLVQFGLAFVVVHTKGQADSESQSVGIKKLELKKKETSDDIVIGSLFAKRKANNEELKGAAAIRAASTSGILDKKINPHVGASLNDSSNQLAATGDQSEALRKKTPYEKNKQKKQKPRNVLNGTLGESSSSASESTSKRRASDNEGSSRKKPTKPRLEKPFNMLLGGVVFTISGFQNPLRGDIRSKALAMGAKYRPDWDNNCTHLVCAFPNTPKFNQVLGHGKIVTKEWVETCYDRRMRLPWRRFALHPPDKKVPESDEEIHEQVERPPSPVDNRRRISPSRSSSEEDTEDEIERVRQNQEKNKLMKAVVKNSSTKKPKAEPINSKLSPKVDLKNNILTPDERKPSTSTSQTYSNKPKIQTAEAEDPYNLDTEEEDEMSESRKWDLPLLPTFFQGIAFHVGSSLDDSEKSSVRRYIFAHKGKLVETKDLSSEEVQFIITRSTKDLEDVKEFYSEVVGLRPEWVWKAHDEGRLPPTASFEL